MLFRSIVGTVAAGVGGYLLSRRAIKPLVESLALQRRFVADASHELRTPLTLLSTRVQLLRRSLLKEGDSRTADEVAEVENDAKALTGILEDLLVAADNRDTGLVAVDLGRLARETASAVAATAAERSLRVTTDISGEAPVVAGIEAPLRRVYLSLLSNALDHATRVVQVHVVGAARTVTIEVADDGPGFPGDARPFERFASDRPDADSARHYGLGLALVADVAARFGGTVEVLAGRPGGVIRIELPRLTREQAAKTTQNSAPSGTS